MKSRLMACAAGLALCVGFGMNAAGASELKFAPGEGPFNWDSYNAWAENAPDLSGQTVTVAGPWLQPEDGFFRNVLAYFTEATGAEVIYTGSDSFEQQIVIDAEAGAAPNIAVFPQPGLAADMAARGLLQPMPDGMGDWV
ncbi:MAG: alpha-glucoside ABC transporter substrate-binding protein, partial [Roseibium sp.]